MRYENVRIEALGHALPAREVTSDELEDRFAHTLARLNLPRGQIVKLAGVHRRRVWEPGTRPSVVGAMAAERALAAAGIPASSVDVLVNGSITRDYIEPACATLVGGSIGVGHGCLCFDVSNACLGFMNGLQVVADLIERGAAKVGVVVVGENFLPGIDTACARLAAPDADFTTFKEQFASLTLGCGAVAVVVTHASVARADHRLHGIAWRYATEHNDLCQAQPTEMRTDTSGLLEHGVALAVETWPLASDEFGWRPGVIDHYVCHQVSLAHFQHVFSRIDQPLEKAILTFPMLGNVGPASLPLTLALGVAQGRIREGERLCLFGVGSGLGCLIGDMTW